MKRQSKKATAKPIGDGSLEASVVEQIQKILDDNGCRIAVAPVIRNGLIEAEAKVVRT